MRFECTILFAYFKAMKIFVKTLGCRANRYESEKLMQGLIEEGHVIVAKPDDAEAVVVNTCTVTHTADRKSRQEIYPHAGKKNESRLAASQKRSLVVVFGCGPRGGSYEIEGVDLVAKEPSEVLEFFRRQTDEKAGTSATLPSLFV